MTTDTTFDLLASPVRREVIAILDDEDAVARDRLTEELAADEDARRRLRIALHHNHLPKLADAGLVTYDEETVTPTDRLDRVARRFRVPRGDDGTPVPI